MGKPQKKGNFSKKLIVMIIILNIVYTAAVLAIMWHTGVEPVVLTPAYFGFTTGELALLFGLKKAKLKKEETECPTQEEI